MKTQSEMFMNCSKDFIGINKNKTNKYDCQIWYTKEMIYVNEQM